CRASALLPTAFSPRPANPFPNPCPAAGHNPALQGMHAGYLTTPAGGSQHAAVAVRSPAMRRLLALSLLLLSSVPVLATDAKMDAPTSGTTAVPAPPAWLEELDGLYDARLRVAGLEQRDFS